MLAFNKISGVKSKMLLFLATMVLKERILTKNVLPSIVKTWIMTLYRKTVQKVQTTAGPKGEK